MFIEQPFQTTLRSKIWLEDIGLHSGRYVHATICPAPANSGIQFRRVDVEGSLQTVSAHANFAKNARLCTRIENADGIGLETVEHFMAAFAGLGVDNVIVEIDAGEAPILDGSSKPVVDAINRVGLTVLSARRRHLVVTKPVEVQLECGAWAKIEPADQLEIDIEIDFEDSAIGKQQYSYLHCDGSFEAELAGARTFCQMRDVEIMQNAGLALGGSLNNAIVVDDGSVLNEGGLRMEDEFVRHKALDCLGDLYLLGMQIRGKLTASRPGHALSTRLVQALWQDKHSYKIVEDGVAISSSDGYAMPELAAAAAV
ncbi:UDP-3-O-acyl-N-acetylglucosamine deacetylase [Alphaproteobacteria bacterium]|jgi:UDP-3-O-[3-hydroxymyristoyl] N-acetylglucosamine deacetylase|nr:UDP-3-O-acyl-N-acetylglucosamine deacetylase [Alphaproteobacteria bacterium]